jgi:hypothetical protein
MEWQNFSGAVASQPKSTHLINLGQSPGSQCRDRKLEPYTIRKVALEVPPGEMKEEAACHLPGSQAKYGTLFTDSTPLPASSYIAPGRLFTLVSIYLNILFKNQSHVKLSSYLAIFNMKLSILLLPSVLVLSAVASTDLQACSSDADCSAPTPYCWAGFRFPGVGNSTSNLPQKLANTNGQKECHDRPEADLAQKRSILEKKAEGTCGGPCPSDGSPCSDPCKVCSGLIVSVLPEFLALVYRESGILMT